MTSANDYVTKIDGVLHTIPECDLLCHHEDCEACGVPARLVTCSECGARAVITDCGHESQPAAISTGRCVDGQLVDLDMVFCEDCG